MGKVWDRMTEWALNVQTGATKEALPAELIGDFIASKQTGPPLRVRRSMIVYARNRDPRRWKRLQEDYAWLEATMKEMGMNPKDARFLL